MDGRADDVYSGRKASMRRRKFVALLGSVMVAWPLAARAQHGAKISRVGFLGNSTADLEANLVGPFRDGLREHGYEEGRNVEIVLLGGRKIRAVSCPHCRTHRRPRGCHRDCRHARHPRAQEGDIDGACGHGSSRRSGWHRHRAEPVAAGGNITGLSGLAPDLEGKRLELLREVVPHLAHVAFFL